MLKGNKNNFFYILIFTTTIFISSFLLFSVQPVINKFFLLWFGGSSSVWNTSMLFFTFLLLAGYIYAHLITTHLSENKQIIIHLILILLTGCYILYHYVVWSSPIIPPDYFKPKNINNPYIDLLFVLFISVGLPYFVLSITNPLLQFWFTKVTTSSPYKLYSFSNIGSLLGLLLYPFFIEPYATVHNQGLFWSITYIFWIILFFSLCAMLYKKLRYKETSSIKKKIDVKSTLDKKEKVKKYFIWIFLSSLPVAFLLAVTNQVTKSVAAIPFLWIIPLSIYLVTYIICFSSKKIYSQKIFIVLLLVITPISISFWSFTRFNVATQLSVHFLALFILAMICHGELYSSKPEKLYLTAYYVCISFGGAIGSMFVSIIAPFLFHYYWEYPLIIALVVLYAMILIPRHIPKGVNVHVINMFRLTYLMMFIYIFIFVTLTRYGLFFSVDRNFYGIVGLVREETNRKGIYINKLISGNIIHGIQYSAGENKYKPNSYFSKNSGIGMLMTRFPKRLQNRPLRVGVIGLGAGVITSYCKHGDSFHFYELNPTMVAYASKYFSYLDNCQGAVKIDIGDGRLLLEEELKNNKTGNYDILLVDAFTDDSIPVHLLTSEALQLYLKHIDKNGAIAFNITNTYINLRPLMIALGKDAKLELRFFYPGEDKKDPFPTPSEWVIMTRNQQLLSDDVFNKKALASVKVKRIKVWTDNYSNLFQVLRY